MIDFGLLLSVILAFGVPSLLAQRWPITSFEAGSASGQASAGRPEQPGITSEESGITFIDAVLASGAAAVLVGRLATLMLDDPAAIGKLHDMLIIRSGVEFWPGVAAAAAWSTFAAKRAGVGPMVRLAALLPLSMVGYAIYESSCVFRSGCAGPVSSIGLRPDGLGARLFPVGIVMGLAVVLGAVALRRLTQANVSASVLVSSGILIVAGVRSIGSFWLPKLGDDLTRQHQTSVVIVALAAVLLAVTWLRDRRTAK